MANEFLSAVILLTLVIDPFGSVPIANAMLSGVDAGLGGIRAFVGGLKTV